MSNYYIFSADCAPTGPGGSWLAPIAPPPPEISQAYSALRTMDLFSPFVWDPSFGANNLATTGA
jgi:hypothetical protein